MASLSTYAKLSLKKQFVPEEEAVFTLQYSNDLVGKYGTIVIDGYLCQLNPDGYPYTGCKITHTLNTIAGGQPFEEFRIPVNTLGQTPVDEPSAFLNGKMQVRVEIGDELDGDPPSDDDTQHGGHVINPEFTSNTVLGDMLIMWPHDCSFSDATSLMATNEYHATSSSCRISSMYYVRHDFGTNGNTEVQSYRYYLYDSNKKLIFDTGELYDWDTNMWWLFPYTFYDLKNDTTYYVRSRFVLNGGYVIYRGTAADPNAFIPIYVHYEDDPDVSPNFSLSNAADGVRCNLDLTGVTYDRVVFSRTKRGAADYLELGTVYNTGNNVSLTDKYAIPNTSYTYRAVAFNGNLIVGTYYNNADYTSSVVKISDIYGCYTAVGDINKHPISRNDRGAILETMDSKFPRNIINGSPDYDSGTTEGLFTDVDDDCNIITDSEYIIAKANILRAWLNNGNAKLLTYYTGEAWIVSVSNIQTTDPENNDIYHTTFNWTQIGDASKIDDYVRLGLVINNE